MKTDKEILETALSNWETAIIDVTIYDRLLELAKKGLEKPERVFLSSPALTDEDKKEIAEAIRVSLLGPEPEPEPESKYVGIQKWMLCNYEEDEAAEIDDNLVFSCDKCNKPEYIGIPHWFLDGYMYGHPPGSILL